MRRNRFLQTVVVAGAIILQSLAFAQEPRPTIPDLQISLPDRLKVFEKLWETVNTYFFDPKFNGANWVQMRGKYRPLVEASADKAQLVDVLGKLVGELHVSHMGVRGDFRFPPYGTGANYIKVEDKWLVSAVAPGSPAQLAGIERGWILTGADGECIAPRTKVAMNFLDLRDQTRTLDLSCATYQPIPAPVGLFRTLDNGAVYLRLTSFSPEPAKWLADQVARNKAASAIVLDLRGNFGGGTETELKVFEMFFSNKAVFGKFRMRTGKEHTLKTGGSKSAYRGRILVLTDNATQSAAEVFAMAIQETGRGVVVGQQSNGGVLLGNHFKLPNGFDLHIAVADYHTAKGIRLEGRGVIPDVVVVQTVKDIRENRDSVLERVNQLLQQP